MADANYQSELPNLQDLLNSLETYSPKPATKIPRGVGVAAVIGDVLSTLGGREANGVKNLIAMNEERNQVKEQARAAGISQRNALRGAEYQTKLQLGISEQSHRRQVEEEAARNEREKQETIESEKRAEARRQKEQNEEIQRNAAALNAASGKYPGQTSEFSPDQIASLNGWNILQAENEARRKEREGLARLDPRILMSDRAFAVQKTRAGNLASTYRSLAGNLAETDPSRTAMLSAADDIEKSASQVNDVIDVYRKGAAASPEGVTDVEQKVNQLESQITQGVQGLVNSGKTQANAARRMTLAQSKTWNDLTEFMVVSEQALRAIDLATNAGAGGPIEGTIGYPLEQLGGFLGNDKLQEWANQNSELNAVQSRVIAGINRPTVGTQFPESEQRAYPGLLANMRTGKTVRLGVLNSIRSTADARIAAISMSPTGPPPEQIAQLRQAIQTILLDKNMKYEDALPRIRAMMGLPTDPLVPSPTGNGTEVPINPQSGHPFYVDPNTMGSGLTFNGHKVFIEKH